MIAGLLLLFIDHIRHHLDRSFATIGVVLSIGGPRIETLSEVLQFCTVILGIIFLILGIVIRIQNMRHNYKTSKRRGSNTGL